MDLALQNLLMCITRVNLAPADYLLIYKGGKGRLYNLLHKKKRLKSAMLITANLNLFLHIFRCKYPTANSTTWFKNLFLWFLSPWTCKSFHPLTHEIILLFPSVPCVTVSQTGETLNTYIPLKDNIMYFPNTFYWFHISRKCNKIMFPTYSNLYQVYP